MRRHSAPLDSVLSAWQLREELKRTQFDERFHLWELEAIRAFATGIGGSSTPLKSPDELINHLVSLLGVRSAHLYLGDSERMPRWWVGSDRNGSSPDELSEAWNQGLYRDDVVALPLNSDSGTVGILVAADKEARAGTEPFAANDVRLLELFAVQVTVAMEYVRLTRESLERERLKRELEMAAVIQSHLHPQHFPEFAGYPSRGPVIFEPASCRGHIRCPSQRRGSRRNGHRCLREGRRRRDDSLRSPRGGATHGRDR